MRTSLSWMAVRGSRHGSSDFCRLALEVRVRRNLTRATRAGAARCAAAAWGRAWRPMGCRPRAGGAVGGAEVLSLGRKAPWGQGVSTAGRAALRGPSWCCGARPEVAAGAGPGRRRDDQLVSQAIGDGFVVDSPPVEIRPGLLGAALDREADLLEHLHGRLELAKGEGDRCLRQRVGVQAPAEHRADPVKTGKPHPEAQPGVRRRRGGGQGEVHGRTVEHGQERQQPGEPGFG